MSALHLLPTNFEGPLALSERITFEEWADVGRALGRMERAVGWWIGDWWAFGESRYGDRAALVRSDGWEGPSYQSCMDSGSVARKFPTSRRREVLTFAHHREVAALPPDEADALLDKAEAVGLTTKELRSVVAQRRNAIGELPDADTCTVDDLAKLSEVGRRFGTIYADPPWLYGNQGTRAATGNHYGGMTVEDICALPVMGLAQDDAHLHLWTTNAFLFDARRVMEAWGFEYKSVFVWVKPQMGIGNYWRVSHEFMLFGVRGSAPFRDRAQMSWRQFDRTEHSAKPEEVRRIIEGASPGPYLELFGRKVATGWTVWGNQIARSMFDTEVDAL